jgi:PAS domain S-box-containing protein
MEIESGQLIQERIKELHENTDFVFTLFESLRGYAIIAADFDGNVIAYNEGAREIFGYSPSEIVGKQNIEVFFTEDFIEAGKLQQIINDLIEGKSLSCNVEMARKNGERFTAKNLFVMTKDKSGRVVGFIEIAEDITERLQFEDTKKQQVMELEAALAHQRALAGWYEGNITAQTAGVGALRERVPNVFSALQKEYESLLDAYLEATGFEMPPPRRKIIDFSDRIGELGCGPRDVVDIHLNAVTEKSKNTNPKRTRAYTLEGRLLALEVMGNLVDYYRLMKYKKGG